MFDDAMDASQPNAQEAAKYYADTMVNFVRIPPESGVNNFVISGPSTDQPVEFNTLIGLYEKPGINVPPEIAIISLDGLDLSMVSWHKKVLTLDIPQRVKQLNSPIDEEAEREVKSIATSIGLPYAVLSVGRAQNVEVVMMSCVYGANPEKVLEEFKSKSRDRLRSIN